MDVRVQSKWESFVRHLFDNCLLVTWNPAFVFMLKHKYAIQILMLYVLEGLGPDPKQYIFEEINRTQMDLWHLGTDEVVLTMLFSYF